MSTLGDVVEEAQLAALVTDSYSTGNVDGVLDDDGGGGVHRPD